MPRFLTPSKVGLLALIVLYAEGSIPNSAAVDVLSFLMNHVIRTPSSASATVLLEADGAIPVESFERVLSPLVSSFPGRTIWDAFLKKIWNIDCADTLHSFLSNITSLLVKSRQEKEREGNDDAHGGQRIAKSSPLGAFIRRSHLEFVRIQFDDAIRLWESFVCYRLPTRYAWEKKNQPDGKHSLDQNLLQLDLDLASPLAHTVYQNIADEEKRLPRGFSNNDVEKLLEFQASEIQRHGSRLPEETGRKIRDMVRSGLPVPNMTHYLSFLDSWRSGDYASAFDNLHRHFDYSVQSRDRSFYQYALLNLAILQADFGCYSEAIPAMKEAISTARENKDMNCLNFCMSWLYHFGKAFPGEMREIQKSGMLGSELEGINFLKAKAKESEMWNLLSNSLLSEAKLGLQNGEGIATAFENLTKASHLNVTKGAFNVMGPQLILRSSLFGRIGSTHLAQVNGDTFLECFSHDSPTEDTLKCKSRLANLLVQEGRYRQALELLESVSSDTLRVLKYQQYWVFFMGLIKLRRHLRRGDLRAADHVHSQLLAQGAPDVEAGFALSMMKVDLLCRRKNFARSLDELESLAKSCYQGNTDIFAQIKLLNVKARILAKCGHTLRGFSITVRAASMAYNARLLPALWESIGNLANILNTLSEFEAALNLLESIAPQVQECQDCEIIAITYSLLVDAHMGLAGDAEPASTARKERLLKVPRLIDASFEAWERIEDLAGQTEMLAKKATIFQLLEDPVTANDYAAKYLNKKKAYTESYIGDD